MFRSNGITLGIKTGIFSEVGLSGGCGLGDVECIDRFVVSTSFEHIGNPVFVSGIIGISFGRFGSIEWLLEIGGDDGVS